MVLRSVRVAADDVETASSVTSNNSQGSLVKDLKDRKRELQENQAESSLRNRSIRTRGTESNSDDNGIEAPTRRLDEAIHLYNYAERAALKIQRTFREQQDEKRSRVIADVATGPECADVDVEKTHEDKLDKYNTIFLASMAVFMILSHLILGSWDLMKRCFGHDTGDAEAAANTTVPKGGGGGGGETGGSQSAAMQGMAAQAAGSAASGAASGATAGAAAAAAAGAAAAGATATAVGATVVALSTAAVAATTAGIRVTVSNSQAFPVILSTCGLTEPDYRSGRFSVFFEGIPRPFDARESLLVEELVLQSYNEITMGNNVTLNGCLDPLSREMLNVTLRTQAFTPIGDGFDNPVLEVLFEASLLCDKCSASRPLLDRDQIRQDEDGEQEDAEYLAALPDNLRHRLLEDFDFESQEFFQKLIQLIIFDTEGLSELGELPRGFIQVSKALVLLDDNHEVLVTEVKYVKEPERTIIEFSYNDEDTDEVMKETFVITARGEEVPTASFPTFQPSNTPTGLPSTEPSGLPTPSPSHVPIGITSSAPTRMASEYPSAHPTTNPSESPSSFPTVEGSLSPSGSPSDTPSLLPSISPSHNPTFSPSQPPSLIPSSAPSRRPTSTPSQSPSGSPSVSPSESPSLNPSLAPSRRPTSTPSQSPSGSPSVLPSESPSSRPSSSPSNVPSFIPSIIPSWVPSLSPSGLPSIAPSSSPSRLPSSAPSSLPSGIPSAGPSSLPSVAP